MIKMSNRLLKLANAISADDVVDWQETEVLLDFIENEIANDADWKVNGLKKLKDTLIKFREDGKITDEESAQLLIGIKKIVDDLKFKERLKILFAVILGVATIGFICAPIWVR